MGHELTNSPCLASDFRKLFFQLLDDGLPLGFISLRFLRFAYQDVALAGFSSVNNDLFDLYSSLTAKPLFSGLWYRKTQ
jgi:hypothetical protein